MFVTRPACFHLILAFAVSSLVIPEVHGEIIYKLRPYSMSTGFSIDSGVIVVTDSAGDDMLLQTSEILSFTVTATDEVGPFTFSGTGLNSVINDPVKIDVKSDIWVEFPPNLKDENLLMLQDPNSLAYAEWLAINLGSDFGSVNLTSRTGLTRRALASAPVTVGGMPEPQSLLLLALGGVALLTLRRQRPLKERRSAISPSYPRP